MTLAAQTVAEAVRSRIGVNAFTDHPHPFPESALPAWRVVSDVEDTEYATMDRIVEHKLDLKVRGYARATDNLDQALNALAATALPLIFAAPVPYGLVPAGDVTRSMASEGQAAVGCIEIPVRAQYYTLATAPETIIS